MNLVRLVGRPWGKGQVFIFNLRESREDPSKIQTVGYQGEVPPGWGRAGKGAAAVLGAPGLCPRKGVFTDTQIQGIRATGILNPSNRDQECPSDVLASLPPSDKRDTASEDAWKTCAC